MKNVEVGYSFFSFLYQTLTISNKKEIECRTDEQGMKNVEVGFKCLYSFEPFLGLKQKLR